MPEGKPPNQGAIHAVATPKGSGDGMPVAAIGGPQMAQEGNFGAQGVVGALPQSSMALPPRTPDQPPGHRCVGPPTYTVAPGHQMAYSPYQEIEELRNKIRLMDKEQFEKELEARRQVREQVYQEGIKIADEYQGEINRLKQELWQKDIKSAKDTSQHKRELRERDAKLATYKKTTEDLKRQAVEMQENIAALRQRRQKENDGCLSSPSTMAAEEEIEQLRERMQEVVRQEGVKIAKLTSDHDANMKKKEMEYRDAISQLKHANGTLQQKEKELSRTVDQLNQKIKEQDAKFDAYKKSMDEVKRHVLETQEETKELRESIHDETDGRGMWMV
ncbi:unnamed protein product [Ostreobium quekettii]|uniref:Uncharacterized protein n=1 Tax=Ostreobium quekettii TaxID=121088 RepID=A0A8S1JDJ6_9CHLO|nr:unnamed protein product [Ostreobium quekettii]